MPQTGNFGPSARSRRAAATLACERGFGGLGMVGMLAALVIVAVLMSSELGATGSSPTKGSSSGATLQIAENGLTTQAQERQTLTTGGGAATTLTSCVGGYFPGGAGVCLALSLASGGEPVLYRVYCPSACPAARAADGTLAQSPSGWPAVP